MNKANSFKKASETAVKMLRNCGFEAFLIGGSVRDYIMNLPIGDIDITTSATPTEVKETFKDFRVIETGIKHGTVTVLIDNEPLEITTYRSEGTYSDNRHPDSVTFSKSLKDDVIRRDFTMNGIAFDFQDGFVDLVGGIDDIKSKTIRAIGDAETRFREDALRILRALRFSSVLGFSIEESTANAIHKCKDLLKNISAERIQVEFSKLICGKNAYSVLKEYADVICMFIPELEKCVDFQQVNRHHIYDVYTHTLKALEQSKNDLHIRLALFLHDIGKPYVAHFDENGEQHYYSHPKKSAELAEKILTRLRFDNETKNAVVTLVKMHDTPIMLDKEDYPSKKRPFYAMESAENQEETVSFDLLFRGLEITTGGQRIHSYEEQVAKMQRRGMNVELFESYLMMHKYGMPPHGGLGLGLERFTSKLLGQENVRRATLFPRDTGRLEP